MSRSPAVAGCAGVRAYGAMGRPPHQMRRDLGAPVEHHGRHAERRERLVLAVPVGMVGVGGSPGDGHPHDADHVRGGVQKGMEAVGADRDRARVEAVEELGRRDEQVEPEDPPKHSGNALEAPRGWWARIVHGSPLGEWSRLLAPRRSVNPVDRSSTAPIIVRGAVICLDMTLRHALIDPIRGIEHARGAGHGLGIGSGRSGRLCDPSPRSRAIHVIQGRSV